MSNAYQIRVRGHISRWLANRMGDFTIAHLPAGDTLLTTTALDQAALYGVINLSRDLGITLISVNPIGEDGCVPSLAHCANTTEKPS